MSKDPALGSHKGDQGVTNSKSESVALPTTGVCFPCCTVDAPPALFTIFKLIVTLWHLHIESCLQVQLVTLLDSRLKLLSQHLDLMPDLNFHLRVLPKCSRSLRSWDHIRELLSRHRVERLLISITVFKRCLQHKHCEPSPLIVFGPSSSSILIILLDETWTWIHIDTSRVVRKNYCESLRTQLGKTCVEDETPDAF